MTIGFKVLSLGIGLGVVGGAGFATHYFLTDNSLGKKLENKGYELLNFDTKKEEGKDTWNEIIKAFVDNKKGFNNLTFSITSSDGTPTKEDVNKLKNSCANIIKSNNYDEITLQFGEQYCVKPVSIKSLIEKNKRVVLDSDIANDNNSEQWNLIVKEYIKEGAKNKLASIEITGLTTTNVKEKRNHLRSGCKTISAKLTHSQNFHRDYKSFYDWCTLPKKAE